MYKYRNVFHEKWINHSLTLLNEAYKKDPEAIEQLVNSRVECNLALAQHPTIQVFHDTKENKFKVGLIGILNGILGIKEDGTGYIAAEYDDNGWLTGFIETK